MTMLLVYTKNGGVVEAKDIRIRANKEAETQFKEYGYSRYKDYADKQIKEVFSGHCNWDLFEKRKNYTLGKVDATFTMLRAFGKIYPITNVS